MSSVKTVDERREDLIQSLFQKSVECMICCCKIRSEVAIFSCQSCFNIFHLYCAKKWSLTLSGDESTKPSVWRCPACQITSETNLPTQYRCFCGKRKDPGNLHHHSSTVPHSCGDVCGRDRKSPLTEEPCGHPCTELCHPGPCPICVFVIKVKCDCSKHENSQQCGRAGRWKCEEICGKRCERGRHQCQQICHSDSCSRCEEIITGFCFSHNTKREIRCCDILEEFEDDRYACGEICGKSLGCEGDHRCKRLCHEGDCGLCPLSPRLVTHCPCGKKKIEKIREKCTDPVETCREICAKTTGTICGHACSLRCHSGDCFCERTTVIRCRCHLRVAKQVKCSDLVDHQIRLSGQNEFSFVCNRPCGRRKSCGRHQCQQKCCDQQTNEHICALECKRVLNCKKHRCSELCHRGPCKRCYEASFDDWHCECGKTVVQAPIACGQAMPECPHPCSRQHDCDHPLRHNCHSLEKCPPCAFLVTKTCRCGKKQIGNVKCFLSTVSCGERCGRQLKCGLHLCQKSCHSDECQSETEKCTQKCPQIRSECGHRCGLQCHGTSQKCPTSECEAEILLKCGCGRIKQITKCGIVGKGQSSSSDVVGSVVARSIECDKECKRQLRLKQIADALKVNVDTSGLPPTEYPDDLKFRARDLGMKFVLGVEEKLAKLVHETMESESANRVLHFEAFGWKKRDFVRRLAEFYGCSAETIGIKSNKFITIDARFGHCYIPTRIMTDALEIDRRVPQPPELVKLENTKTVDD